MDTMQCNHHIMNGLCLCVCVCLFVIPSGAFCAARLWSLTPAFDSMSLRRVDTTLPHTSPIMVQPVGG